MAGFNHRWRQIVDAPAPTPSSWREGWFNHACTWQNCHGQQIVAEVMYDYVTGRQGRITDSRKCVCQEHLDKWLKKNPEAREINPRPYHDH